MRMPFGKHRGREIRDCPIDYLRWCLDNVEFRNPALRRAIRNHVEWCEESPEGPTPPPAPGLPPALVKRWIRDVHHEMARQFHPDLRNGSHEAMTAVNAFKDRLEETMPRNAN